VGGGGEKKICDLLAGTIDSELMKQKAKLGTLTLFGFNGNPMWATANKGRLAFDVLEGCGFWKRETGCGWKKS